MTDEQETTFGEVTDEERNLALLTHILGILTGFLGPLVIWLVKKDDSPFLDQHGKEALNFQISVVLYSLPIIVITFITCGIGAILVLPLIIYIWVGCILAAMQGHRGEAAHYPLTIRLLS